MKLEIEPRGEKIVTITNIRYRIFQVLDREEYCVIGFKDENMYISFCGELEEVELWFKLHEESWNRL